jgi:hypothetical protein
VNRAGYGQAAFFGGLVMGVLSALPIVNLGNCVCCMWVVIGGVVAAYVLQQNQSTPISASDGALVGLLAGLIGAVIQTAIDIPISFVVAPFRRQIFDRILDMAGNMPPDLRDAMDRYSRGGAPVALAIVGRLVAIMFLMCIGAVFSTIGGLLGAAIFKKDLPPGTIDVTPTPPPVG